MTVKGLVQWAAGLYLAGLVFRLVARVALFGDNVSVVVRVLGIALSLAGVVVICAAALAKIIEIGVRSSRR